jgi:hypothetical protein
MEEYARTLIGPRKTRIARMNDATGRTLRTVRQ